jgi:hypothetical protein
MGRQELIRYEFDRPRTDILVEFLEGARALIHGIGGVMWVSADLSLFLPEGETASAYFEVGGQNPARFQRAADRLVADLRHHAPGFADVASALVEQYQAAGPPFLPFVAYRHPENSPTPDDVLLDFLLGHISNGRSWGYAVLAEAYPPSAFNLKAG